MRGKPESPAEHLAVGHEAALRRAFVVALGQTIGAHLTLPRLTSALETRRSFQLTESQPWLDFTNDLYARVQAVLAEVFVASAKHFVRDPVAKESRPNPRPQPSAQAGLRFDLTNPFAVRYAEQYAASLILDLSQTSRNAVIQIVTRMMNGELTPDSAARLIRASVGLTPRQVASLERFRADLVRLEHEAAYIDRKVEEYGRRKLAERATTIARTEAMRAANAGQKAAWQASAQQGLIPANGVRRMWLTTIDERTCPICAPLDGQLTTLDEPWPGGYEPGEVHPNCRCAQRLVYAEDDGRFPTRAPRGAPASRSPSRSLRPRVRAA